jgi:hypothetical protein
VHAATKSATAAARARGSRFRRRAMPRQSNSTAPARKVKVRPFCGRTGG